MKTALHWNPDRYHLFQKERSAPFEDLFRLISVRPGLEVVDLGCGTGNLTLELANRLPDSQVLGIDSSSEMLERAQQLERPGLQFREGLIQEVQGSWDLVFSNAAIQWIEDHGQLVPRLFSLVRPGGQLVVQLPSNHNHIAHRLIVAAASEEPYRSALDGWIRQSPALGIEDYAQILYDQGGEKITVFEKVYPHVLEDAGAVADWSSGTALLPYMERLPENLREPFFERYRQSLYQHWPSGPVFYGFRRILFAASRASE